MYKLLGIVDDQTTCDLCGKPELKCTMALQQYDEDANAVGEVVYFGRDCGAKALGWRVSADRAEKLAKGTARMDYAAIHSIWTNGFNGHPTRPARGELDGVAIEVWDSFYGKAPGTGWTLLSKATKLHWRVAR